MVYRMRKHHANIMADIHLISSRPRKERTLKDAIADLSARIPEMDNLDEAMLTYKWCRWFEQEASRLTTLAGKRCSELTNKEPS